MEFIQHYSRSHFLGLAQKIRVNPASWQIVDASLTGKTLHNPFYIARMLKNYFDGKEGVILLSSRKKIVALVNMGDKINGEQLVAGIEEKLPRYSCALEATTLTEAGIVKLQLRFQDIEDLQQDYLFKIRQVRQQKIIFVVDDDLYIRTLLKTRLAKKAMIVEFADAGTVAERYLELLPDAVLTDIHLPGGSGLDLVKDIRSFDDSAYVIVMSVDRIKERVMNAQKYGARDFLAKPFTPEKLIACLEKCPTFSSSKI